MSQANVLNVGIIGTGMAFERLRLPAYQELADKFRITALCDREREKALAWTGRLGLSEEDVYSDYRELARRDDLQVIDIMVPIELNYKVTAGVAEVVSGRNKPPAIIEEKPLAPTLEQAKAHRELAKKYGIPILIAENYRYNEDVNILRDLVREGHTGETAYFLYHRAQDFPAEMRQDTFAAKEWRQHPEFPGGIFYDSGVHDMAALRHIFGGIDEVFAFGRHQDSTLGQLAVVQVNLRFLSGLTGQYTFYAGGRELIDPPAGFRIIGDKGQIYQADRYAGVIHLTYADGSSREISYRPQRGFYNELLNLYNAYTGKEPIAVTPEMAFGDAKTIFAILESLAEGVPIPVDEKPSYTPDYQSAYGQQETGQLEKVDPHIP